MPSSPTSEPYVPVAASDAQPPGRESDGRPRPASPAITIGRVIWPAALSILVLLVVAYFTFDISDFRDTVQGLNPWFLTAAVAAVIVRVMLGGLRLRYISSGVLGYMAGVRGQLAWDFFSNITPAAIGGGPVAALYVARDRQIAVGEATAIMLFTMLMDQLLFATLIPVLLLAAPYIDIFPRSLGPVGTGAFVTLFLAMMGWVAVFGYAVLFRPEWLQKIVVGIAKIKGLRRYKSRVESEMNQLRASSRILKTKPPRFFATAMLLTCATWCARFVLPLLIVWSIYPEVEQGLFFLRTIAISVGTIVLPTPGGSGGVEGLYVLFLGPLMPPSVVAPTLLVWRVLGYYIFLGVGVYLFMHHAQTTVERKRLNARTANGEADADDSEAALDENEVRFDDA